jgi:transposase
MYVKQTRMKNGTVNVSIVQAYWQDGRSRSRTVRGLGRLDILDATHGDGLAWAKRLCEELGRKVADETADVPIKIHPKQKIDRRSQNIKNIGCVIPLAYYNSLGIEKTLRNHAADRRFDFDVNSVLRLLVTDRMVSPGSKLSAHTEKDSYFFRTDFSDDDVYRSLDFISACKDALVSAMNRAIGKRHERNLTDAYYDVTNYYFEIDEEDGLRKNGVSKEKRRKPIVQLGLLQDSDGIPLGFDVFSGNTSDCETMLPVMKAARRDLGLGRVVMVADKGLNTSSNIAACTLDGNGFVFSQSIRGKKSSEELRCWVISEDGYETKPDDEGGPGFKIKSRQDTKVIHITDTGGKTKDVKMEVKVVAFWSAKYDHRAKVERAKVVEKAKTLVENIGAYDRATHYGAARYIKGVVINKKTGELDTQAGCVPMIDAELIVEEGRLDGYYCIVTSEYGLSDEQIVDIYRGLWRIEEAFKVTKSHLKARPVFVWTPEHIKAHFLICYIALVIIRLIQKDTGYRHSAGAILSEIAQLNGVHLHGNWWRFYHRSDLSDELAKAVGLDLSLANMQLTDIKKLLKKPEKG